MNANEAISLLNDNDLAGTWSVFLKNYYSSGIPDKKDLNKIGNALGIDAILQGEIVNVFQRDKGFDDKGGETKVTLRFSMFSTIDGILLWEASSDGVKTYLYDNDSAPPVIDAVDLAVDKILTTLPLK